MITIIAIVFFLLGVFSLYEDRSIISSIISFTVLLIGVTLGIFSIKEINNTKLELEYRKEIISLTTFNGVRGHFTLGSGLFENEATYYFYTNSNGYYELNKVKAENAKIKMDGDHHYVEKYCWKPNKNILFIRNRYEDEYIIVIPEGSIITNFDANVK